MRGTGSYGLAADRARLWSGELLEALLPRQPRAGMPVLLACDDETIRSVGEWLGHDRTAATSRFVGDVKVAFQIDAATGLGRANAGRFVSAQRPRPLPDFFPVLCLLVLAASRMEPDKHSSTHAYYVRLRELLGIGGRGALPDIEFVPRLFDCLADWLDNDLEGARGRLLLPSDPQPRYVGTIVSQTVFRRRDRQVLTQFFSQRLGTSLEGSDPLRRLRRWPGRWSLTNNALRRVHDDTIAEQVRAAIHTAYRSWDGSLLTSAPVGFGRRWRGRLHLLSFPLRLHLSAGNTEEITFELDGQPLVLEPRGEVEIPFSLLQQTRWNELVLGRHPDSVGVLWLPRHGDTILFELGESGLLQVDRPSGADVWVLTCEGRLQSRLAPWRVREHVLPVPWQLFRRAPVTELPGIEPETAPQAAGDFWLEGGLPLATRRYFSGPGPMLAAGVVDEEVPLQVTVNDLPWATIASGGRVRLPGELGIVDVVVGGDEWSTTYEVEEHGVPEPTGTLAHRLEGARALRAGARPDTGDGVRVSGATISVPYPHDPPILTRVSAELVTIDRAGVLVRHRRPPTPAWLRQVGLGDHVTPRWEIIRDGVVWLLCPNPRLGRPWAELQRAATVERLTPAAAELVVGMARSDRLHLTVRRGSHFGHTGVDIVWDSLVRRALAMLPDGGEPG